MKNGNGVGQGDRAGSQHLAPRNPLGNAPAVRPIKEQLNEEDAHHQVDQVGGNHPAPIGENRIGGDIEVEGRVAQDGHDHAGQHRPSKGLPPLRRGLTFATRPEELDQDDQVEGEPEQGGHQVDRRRRRKDDAVDELPGHVENDRGGGDGVGLLPDRDSDRQHIDDQPQQVAQESESVREWWGVGREQLVQAREGAARSLALGLLEEKEDHRLSPGQSRNPPWQRARAGEARSACGSGKRVRVDAGAEAAIHSIETIPVDRFEGRDLRRRWFDFDGLEGLGGVLDYGGPKGDVAEHLGDQLMNRELSCHGRLL